MKTKGVGTVFPRQGGRMLGIPVLSRGAALLGAVPMGWGMGSCRRLISQSNKNSSSKCTVGLFLWDLHKKSGFPLMALGRGVLPSAKIQSSGLCWCISYILPALLAASLGSPPPCPPCHPMGDAHPSLTFPDYHPSPGTSAQPLQNRWSRAELGACGPLFAASLCRVLEQLSPNMEGFFCLRFSARRPRPKSAAFQMLRSAQLFFPPPAPSLLLPSGLGPAPTGIGVIPPPQLTGIPGSPTSILCCWHKPDPATPKAMVIKILGDKEATEKGT